MRGGDIVGGHHDLGAVRAECSIHAGEMRKHREIRVDEAARRVRVLELHVELEQFVEQVKLRAYDDKYIDKNEEREILQIALQHGITVDSARAALAQVCESNGYVLESSALKAVKEMIEIQANNDGKIDQKEFNDCVTTCKKQTQGKKNDVQCKRMVIEIIQDNAFKVKQGMFNHWYDKVKKDVGMA